MKARTSSKRSLAIVLFCVISIGLFITVFRLSPFKQSGETSRRARRPEVPSEPKRAEVTSTKKAVAESDRRFSTAELSSYLQAKGHSAGAYAAVYDLTTDETLLKEALQRHPEASALLARGAWLLSDKALAGECAKRLIATQPDSSIGWYLSGMLALNASGDFSEAENFLVKGLERKPPVLFDEENATERREALVSLGFSTQEARVKGLFGQIANAGPLKLDEAWTKIGKSNNQSLIEKGIGMTQHFMLDPRSPSGFQLAAMNSQIAMIRLLPGDQEFGDTGKTLAERKVDLEQRRKTLAKAIIFFNRSYTEGRMSPSQQVSWADDVLLRGDTAALMKVFEQQN